jgi:hypothetical protein
MDEEWHSSPCDAFSDHLAELALGILTGRDRAATLAHVESCARCAEELEQLSRMADAIVAVGPEIEPPVGFEVGLFSQMGVDEVSVRRQARPHRWILASAAAAVALAVGLTIGWSAGSQPASTPDAIQPAGTPVQAVSLLQNGKPVGRVSTYGGATPWMFMTLADSSARGHVICEVITTDGVVHTVGSFTADKGYGAWGAPLPVSPQDIREAQVVSSGGTVIATATLKA